MESHMKLLGVFQAFQVKSNETPLFFADGLKSMILTVLTRVLMARYCCLSASKLDHQYRWLAGGYDLEIGPF